MFNYSEAKALAQAFIVWNRIDYARACNLLPHRSADEIKVFVENLIECPNMFPRSIQNLFKIVKKNFSNGLPCKERVNVARSMRLFSEKSTDIAYDMIEEIFFE